jgi:uncharacterized protein
MSFKTPGVYIQEIALFPPSVAQVSTAIPAFIGCTEFAKKEVTDDLLRKPTRIKSMLEYQQLFGGPQPQALVVNVDANNLPVSVKNPVASNYRMFYALQLYFANGGGPCYIVSIGNYGTTVTAARLGVSGGATPGGLDLIKKIDEVTLLLFPDAHALASANYYGPFISALTQCNDLQDRFTIIDLRRNVGTDPVDFFRNAIGNQHLKYGAAYWPWLITNLNYQYDGNSVSFLQPDDGKGATGPLHNATLASATPSLLTEAFMNQLEVAINKVFIEMPPGPAIAGVYASVDRNRGVWKAPANVSLNSVMAPAIKLNDADQGSLNVHSTGKSVNAIRAFTGKGVLVWGARTLAGNDNEWRYVSVRRFFNMVEESVKKATEQFVFEPNDANTWVKVRAMIENFLVVLWRQGALAGATPQDAFFVKVGLGETMTAIDILEGRMNVEIGLAAVRPAEFIILRFSHKMQVS